MSARESALRALLAFERGERKVTFAKVNGTWKVKAPLAADAEQNALDDLVNELAKLRAADWAAGPGAAARSAVAGRGSGSAEAFMRGG